MPCCRCVRPYLHGARDLLLGDEHDLVDELVADAEDLGRELGDEDAVGALRRRERLRHAP